MTPEQLANIQARADAATEGPWAVDELGNVEDVPEVDPHRFDVMPQAIARIELRKQDAEFIAHARTDVPALLALVREQQARIERGLVLARNLDRLAPGDQHYAGLIRAALTAAEVTA